MIRSVNSSGITMRSMNVVLKRCNGIRKYPSPGLSMGRFTQTVRDVDVLPASMRHTLDSNAICRSKASVIIMTKETNAATEAALITAKERGYESTVDVDGILWSIIVDTDCTFGTLSDAFGVNSAP